MSRDAPPAPRFSGQNCIDRQQHRAQTCGLGRGATEELPMNDAQRHRRNAAQCLSAAEKCRPTYRRLAFTIAAHWVALARQQKVVDELLANCSEAKAPT